LIGLESLAENTEIKKDKTSAAFIDNIIKTIKAKPEAIAYAAGFGLCLMLRDILGEEHNGREAKLLMDHWHLDCKFREAFQSMNIRSDEAQRVVELFKAVLKRIDSDEYIQLAPAVLAKVLADEALESSDYKDVLGLNLFDNIIWFNKERFDDTLFCVSLFVVLENPGTCKMAAETVQLFKTAEKDSGYKLEVLCNTLEK
jgi:hypothetical protein